MKKLLCLLGTITMISSAGVSLVACKRTIINDGDEFDYEAAKNKLIQEVSEIISLNLNQDFKNYQLLENQVAENQFESISISKFLNILEEQGKNELQLPFNSQNFKDISKDLKGIVDLTKINSDINEKIVKNINFKPILVNGSPFKNDYEVNSIKLLKKSDGVVEMVFDFGFNLQINNSEGITLNETIINKQFINLFKDADVAKTINELSESVKEQLESEKYVNSMVFTSDSGDFSKGIDKINSDFSIKSTIKEAVIEAQSNVENSQGFIIDTQESNLVTEKLYTVFGESKTENWINREWNTLEDDSWTEGLFSAITSLGMEKINILAQRMVEEANANKNLEFMRAIHPFKVQNEVASLLLEDENSSWAVNHYNLDYYMKNKNLFPYLSAKIADSKFKIDKIEDKKTIAIWGTTLENIFLTYTDPDTKEEIKVTTPDYFTFNRQRTSMIDTNELNRQFNIGFLEVCRNFFGFENFNINENPEMVYNISLPEDVTKNLEVGISYNSAPIMKAALEETIKRTSISNPIISELINGFVIIPTTLQDSYIKINSSGYIYSFNADGIKQENTMAIFRWQGEGDLEPLENPNYQYRIFPKRYPGQPEEFGEEATKWRISSWIR
ncbi:hypothetical protein [Spiroplasma alleghenense]|uniref:Lipoprotein n=1 Tax=Spiroplasma alleghenense TaxID=216931 RepID=A0A345Z4J1_9MOLU|nr:hypothetical protein [Spiroplasma alleghenense]AXK51520.1 hypothetical protein SALLE_v1c08500 [Spiroplasma alleghenense]